MTKWIMVIMVLTGTSVLGGCQETGTGLSDNADKTNDQRSHSLLTLESVPGKDELSGPPSVGTTRVLTAVMANLVQQTVQDLREKLNIEQAHRAHDIVVLEAQVVTWPDSAVGCPRPGMQYMQMLTRGTRIVLGVGNERYYYHGRQDQTPVLCEKPSPVKPYVAGPDER